MTSVSRYLIYNVPPETTRKNLEDHIRRIVHLNKNEELNLICGQTKASFQSTKPLTETQWRELEKFRDHKLAIVHAISETKLEISARDGDILNYFEDNLRKAVSAKSSPNNTAERLTLEGHSADLIVALNYLEGERHKSEAQNHQDSTTKKWETTATQRPEQRYSREVSGGAPSSPPPPVALQSLALQMFSFMLPSGIRVAVFKGDLLEQKTEAVLSPTNKTLSNADGVAKAIADAAGSELNKECASYVDIHGTLKVADVIRTTSGDLNPPIKFVLHAVVPDADDSPDPAQQRAWLEATFFNCLRCANEMSISTVSIPAAISAMTGMSKELVAQSAFAAVVKFETATKRSKALKVICFVNTDDESNDVFIDAFSRSTAEIKRPSQLGNNNGSTKMDNAEHGKAQKTYNGGTGKAPSSEKHSASKDHGKDGVDEYKSSSAFSADKRSTVIRSATLVNDQTGKSQASPSEKVSKDTSQKNKDGDSRGDPATSLTAKESIPKTSSKSVNQTGDGEKECGRCKRPMQTSRFLQCGHRFCEGCIIEMITKWQTKCPSCGDKLRLNQPHGTMKVSLSPQPMPGYDEHVKTQVVEYKLPNGTQSGHHPNPGQTYQGKKFNAYLPTTTKVEKCSNFFRELSTPDCSSPSILTTESCATSTKRQG